MPEKVTVILDTSCLIVMARCGALNILQLLFTDVIVSQEVADEYGESLPTGVSVHVPNTPYNHEDNTDGLGRGEASSIHIAKQLENPMLVIDELKGRRIAEQQGIPVTGTLAILFEAHKRGVLPDLKATIDTMLANGFRISPKLLNHFLEKI